MANPIKVDILGDAKGLTTALGQAKASLTGFNVASKKSALVAGGLATAGLAAGAAVVSAAIDMDQHMKDFALGTGLAGKELDAAFNEALDAAGRVPEAIEETIAAAGNLQTTTGFLGDDLEDLTVQFMDLNRLGFGALTENQVGEAINIWGLSAEEAEGAFDILAQTAQATGVDIGTMTDLVTSQAGAFKEMGLDMEESVMLLGSWEKAGIDVNKVAKGMNSNIDMLVTQGADVEGMFQDLTSAMDDGVLSAEETQLAYDLLGAEATDVVDALKSGRISFSDLSGQMGLTGQTVEQMADANASLGERFSEVKNRIMTDLAPALLVIGEHFADLVTWLLDNVPKGVEAIKDFVDDSIEFFKKLWKQVEPIFKALKTTFEGVFKTITGVWKAFKSLFKGDFKGFWQGIKQIFSGIVKTFKGVFKLGWEQLKLYARTALAAFKAMFREKIQDVVDYFKRLPGRMKNALAGAWSTFRIKINELMATVKNKVKEKIDDIVGFVKDLPGRIKTAAKGAFDGIKEAFTGVTNAIRTAWNAIDPKVSVSIPGWVPGVGGKSWSSGDLIPDFAHGGTAPSGLSIVGENGPELLRLPLGGSVESTRDAFGSNGGGGAGTSVTVNVHGSDATPEQIAAAVVWKMRRS